MNEETPQDLRERLREYALRIVTMYRSLPKSTEAQVLGRQVLRSGTSVGANHREACRARSTAEFVAKVGDCLKELDETDYWLDLLVASEIVPEKRMSFLIGETDQLMAIMTTIVKKTKNKDS